MINKRLMKTFPQSMSAIKKNVLCQWIGLLANTILSGALAYLIASALTGKAISCGIVFSIMILCVLIRVFMTKMSTMASFESSTLVKEEMRKKLFSKLIQIGPSYLNRWSTAEIVQLFSEGVDQLEVYFGSYIPQFFYAMIAPFTLFAITLFLNWKAALVLLVCVPLIPASIIFVQKFAKKLLNKYWGKYTQLGDSFLENIQGLTTLKAYEADEAKHIQMNGESEQFRKITMRVLIMQLNSISVMDLVAYGGAVAGILVALFAYQAHTTTLFQTIFILLLSADFFIPMRTLGSYFHIAMNGMAASDKMFAILDAPVDTQRNEQLDELSLLAMDNVDFSYDEKPILKNICLEIQKGKKAALVGESGSGKSTIAKLLMGQMVPDHGSIRWNQIDMEKANYQSLYEHVSYLGHESVLFKGTIRSNLKMANEHASEQEMWNVLKVAGIADYLQTINGLDEIVEEGGSNFSGGQKQRLALARILLKKSDLLILDEATSNVDAQTEDQIMEVVDHLKEKTIFCISHRLKNVENADIIYVLKEGQIVEQGSHEELLNRKNEYARLWNAQQELEKYSQGGLYEKK